MKKETYKKIIEKEVEKFRKIHQKLVDVTEKFLENKDNYIDTDYDYSIRKMEQFLFTYAYIVDELNRLSYKRYSYSGTEYKKSMLKKIRKCLGYTL